MNNSTIVEVQNLHHSYGDRIALKGISFSVKEAEIFGLLGPNGGGKSTTFKILSTILPLQQGSVRVAGNDVHSQSDDVRKHIGVVFQSPSVDEKLTVLENLYHQGHLYGLYGAQLQSRATAMLSRLSLLDRKDEIVEKLSGGLQRRVEIAKSLLHSPTLLLLDEPSTGLDPGARIALWDLLFELRRDEHITILLTTHLLEEAEKCDTLAILDEGNLVAFGTPSNLKQEIGVDVISIGAVKLQELFKKIQEKFGNIGTIMDATIRIERENGHEFIPQVVSAFPNEISSITLSKPSLEDVFIRKTGKKYTGNV